jgi:hypothetical protein
MQKVSIQAKGVGTFFEVVLKQEFSQQAAFQIPHLHFALGCVGRTEERCRLFESAKVPVVTPETPPRRPACSVCKSGCIASPYAPNIKWMYNGGCSLWFTISAKSTLLGRSSTFRRSKTSVKPPAMREIGIPINLRSGKAL